MKNMAQEIERKFLIKGDLTGSAKSVVMIRQGYLANDDNKDIRVRLIDGEKAYITIKINSSNLLSRQEWEYEIPVFDAIELLVQCDPNVSKDRFVFDINGFIYEVDNFIGDNSGLVIAEIELESENQEFDKPEWLGEEITGIEKYYNSNLSINPYKNWKDER